MHDLDESPGAPPDPLPTPDLQTKAEPTPRGAWIASGLVMATLILSYFPNLRELRETWESDPNYSHGYLVLPIVALVVWKLRRDADQVEARPAAWGWLLLVASLSARAFFFSSEKGWLESATLLPAVTGLVVAYGGWPYIRKYWTAIAFLAFMYPLPGRINDTLAMQLQSLATYLTCRVLRLLGLWVLDEGNVIIVGSERLEVAAACSGLSMLMSLAATVVTAILLVPMSRWKQVVLLFSIVPIALVSNVIRISVTAWCYHLYGHEIGEKWAHDLAGWMMMPLALSLVFLELFILSLLVVEESEGPQKMPRFDINQGLPS